MKLVHFITGALVGTCYVLLPPAVSIYVFLGGIFCFAFIALLNTRLACEATGGGTQRIEPRVFDNNSSSCESSSANPSSLATDLLAVGGMALGDNLFEQNPGVNPATGLPMVNNCVDVAGNVFGTGSPGGFGSFNNFGGVDSFGSSGGFDSSDMGML
jgi:hypothetical protein